MQGIILYGGKRIASPNSKQKLKANDHSHGGSNTMNFRERVLERDGYRCQLCGVTEDRCFYLFVHHIKPISKFPELKYDINNCITLCESCHNGIANFKTSMEV